VNDLTKAPVTDPTAIYRMRDGLFAEDMFIAALVGLDFFTWIAANPADVENICRHFEFKNRPVDAMTTLFVAMGLLRREGDILHATDTAREHLVAGSPWCIKPYFPKLDDRPIARDYLEILRSGLPANFVGRKNEADWHRAMETEKFAEEFTAAMDCRGVLLAQALAKNLDLKNHHRLLDIAGGSGIYACSLAAHFPHFRATVLEKSPVNKIAARAIGRRGFSDRVDVVVGDMLAAPLPEGYDVHLFSNVLHDWDVDVVKQLLRTSAKALPRGGLLIIHDAFLDAEKTGPLHIAEYSVLLVHVTQGRCYSVAEMGSWLHEAGFGDAQQVPGAAARSALVAAKL
jgi:predicted O-methyltransferase YrrM